jgi:hypothetical protein
MKNIVVLISIILGSSQLDVAQKNEDFLDKISVGLKAGVNLSNVYDEEGEEFRADAKLGLAVGGFLHVPIGEFFGFHPEVLVSQRGFQATGVVLGSTYSFTRTSTFLDVPLLFAIQPADFITLLIGPQYAYMMKQKDVFSNSSTSFDQESEFMKDDIRKNTLCITGGVDINLNQIVLGARFGADLMKNIGSGESESPRYKNMWYQASIGFRF